MEEIVVKAIEAMRRRGFDVHAVQGRAAGAGAGIEYDPRRSERWRRRVDDHSGASPNP